MSFEKAGAAMNRRNATTLVEVLVAIFIMGIGLLAILALFPLGAVQMAQAIKDERSAQAAANAAAYARIIWKQACDADPNSSAPTFRVPATPAPPSPPSYFPYPRSQQRFVMALDDPNYHDTAALNDPRYPGIPNTPLPAPLPSPPPFGSGPPTAYPDMSPMPLTGPDANRSSYPVFVDMFGWNAWQSGNQQWWVGHGISPLPQPTRDSNGNLVNKIGLIPRRPLYVRNPVTPTTPWLRLGIDAPFNNVQRIFKQFSLLDDITFKDDGTPDVIGNRMQRQGRYSWAYMYRRVRNKDNRNQVDVSIIVYSGRSLDVPTDERQFYALSQPNSLISGSRSVRLAYTGAKPELKRGQWVMDGTMFDKNGVPFSQGRFYRVVNVEDGAPTTAADNIPSSSTLSIEVQTPIAFGPDPDANGQNPRIFVVMSNVVEVFLIGEVSQNSPPRLFIDDQEF
jgi:type II secretory pathway pseudopilin PulG